MTAERGKLIDVNNLKELIDALLTPADIPQKQTRIYAECEEYAHAIWYVEHATDSEGNRAVILHLGHIGKI